MSGGLLAVASVKGSPGVTTAAVAFAAAWPTSRPAGMPVVPVVLVEADPAGGSVGGWYRLDEHPGLLSWAAAARSGPAPLAGHTQTLPGGLTVVPGPLGPAQARAALGVLAQTGTLPAAAAAGGVVVVADCGRLDPQSPAGPIAAGAGVLVVLVRPDPYELARLASRAVELTGGGRWEVVVVLAGPSAWPAGQVEAAVGLPVAGVLPHDPRGAAALTGAGTRRRGPGRSPLARAAADIAHALAGRLTRARPASAGSAPAPVGWGTPAGLPARPGQPSGPAGARTAGGPAAPAGVPSRRGPAGPPADPGSPRGLPAAAPQLPARPGEQTAPAGPGAGVGGWVPQIPQEVGRRLDGAAPARPGSNAPVDGAQQRRAIAPARPVPPRPAVPAVEWAWLAGPEGGRQW
jgi:hypothetical protein